MRGIKHFFSTIIFLGACLLLNRFVSLSFAQVSNSLTVDVKKIVRDTSPLIFGLTNSPDPSWISAWDVLENVGVTMIRKDYNIEKLTPDTTLANYKANVNNVQNIANWNQTFLNYHGGIFANSQDRKMRTLGIIDYTPSWLTYDGSTKGIPKDWAVWEDLVKKSHTYFKNNLDAVEVWNEPNYHAFLNINGSPYTNRADAYIDLFKHTYTAVRSVDPTIPIGGPAGYSATDKEFLRAILSDQFVRDHLDFVSVHSYPHTNMDQFTSTLATRSVLAEYGLQNLPIAVSEWNFTTGTPDDRNTESTGISFIGKNWLDFWRNGVIYANYYVGRPYTSQGVMAFYTWVNSIAQPLPQTRAFQVASQSLAMGKGTGKLLDSVVTGSIDGVGLLNPSQHPVAFVTNDTANTQYLQITFTNLPDNQMYLIEYYEGSALNSGAKEYKTINQTTQHNQLILSASIPRTSVLGVVLTPHSFSACHADINQDTIVDISDYGLLVSDFLKTNPQQPRTDINLDGIIDISDYAIMVEFFLQRCQ